MTKELVEEARQEESIHDKLGDGFTEGSEERAFYYAHRDRYKRLADALEAATRADVATEERIDRWMQLVGKAVEKRMTAEAERDAAVEAVERVRDVATSVLLSETDPPNDWNQALDYLTKQILAALDGAPEPEWEWAVSVPGDDDPFSDVYQTREHLAEQETGIAWGDEQLVRRRPAGPWLPVEGESK